MMTWLKTLLIIFKHLRCYTRPVATGVDGVARSPPGVQGRRRRGHKASGGAGFPLSVSEHVGREDSGREGAWVGYWTDGVRQICPVWRMVYMTAIESMIPILLDPVFG